MSERRISGASVETEDILSPEPHEWDRQTYLRLVSEDLSDEEWTRIAMPSETHPRQRFVLAVHWHPEKVPLELIRQRVDATFPGKEIELIIPTQHNVLMTYDGLTGAEIDCYSPEFNQKIQLLIHFEEERVARADVLKGMLSHTFKYRAHQLFEFIDTVIDPTYDDRLQLAVTQTGADEPLVRFVKAQVTRIRRMLEEYEAQTPPDAYKNKLLRHFFDAKREHLDRVLIDRAQRLLKAVKSIVKRNFGLGYFYETRQVIEEVRGIGGGIVIPHPEQFWPVLLADYDVDGYEVWNPQSRRYTEFLIHVVNTQNQAHPERDRPILIFMGDDCHMGEKTGDPRYWDPEKSGREIGVQPAWDDMSVRKQLIVASADRKRVIEQYRVRLGG